VKGFSPDRVGPLTQERGNLQPGSRGNMNKKNWGKFPENNCLGGDNGDGS